MSQHENCPYPYQDAINGQATQHEIPCMSSVQGNTQEATTHANGSTFAEDSGSLTIGSLPNIRLTCMV